MPENSPNASLGVSSAQESLFFGLWEVECASLVCGSCRDHENITPDILEDDQTYSHVTVVDTC